MSVRFPLLILLLSTTGCLSANVYGTPRTTPKGSAAFTAAAEAYAITGENVKTIAVDGNRVRRTESVALLLPTLPTFQVRYGIVDNVDLGLRLASLTSFAFDVKANFLRSEIFDAAIAPGLQWFTRDESQVFFLHAPFILGFNVAEPLTIVLTPGFTYQLVTGKTSRSDAELALLTGSSRPLARFGLGFNIRLTKSFAIQPEATLLRSFDTQSANLIALGLGFNFGRLPSYGKEEEKKKPLKPGEVNTPGRDNLEALPEVPRR